MDGLPGEAAVLSVLRLGVVLFAGAAAVGVWRRVSLWRRGRPAQVDVWSGLVALPRRYLRDVHDVVARDPLAARMHALAAGGLIAAGLLFLIDLALGRPAWLQAPGMLAAAAMVAGSAIALWRRLAAGAGRAMRSQGEWNRFVLMLGILALGLLTWFAAPRGGGTSVMLWFSTAAILVGSAEIGLGLLVGGPIRHVLAGALNLAFHPRPARFGAARPSTGLAPVDLGAERLGVAAAADLGWNRLLNVDACVQCGRCETACPAFAAGQPLNPKALIYDLASGATLSSAMGPYAGSPHPGRSPPVPASSPAAPLLPAIIDPATLWSCTSCRACVSACPMMIEHVDMIVDLRRHEALGKGAIPDKAAETLTRLRDTGSQSGGDRENRFLWAADLDLRHLAPGESCDILWIVGEAGYVQRNQRTLRAFARLLKVAGVDVAVLGRDETDCGDLARRLGEEHVASMLADDLRATLDTRRFARIVTTDPHVMNSLRNDYPLLGTRYVVQHHTELLADLIADGRLKVTGRIESSVAYHDPCYLGRWNGQYEAPRAILAAIVPDLRDMERSREKARCCGGGGGAPLADIPGKARIPDQRMEDVKATGATIVAAACPNCMVMLEGVPGDRPEVADVAELLASCVAGAGEPA